MPSSFEGRVWQLAKKIPIGRITTYQEMARTMGQPGAARAVGNALNKNSDPVKVPCHRVVRSNGEIGDYAKGALAKKKLLLKEGIRIKNNKVVDLGNYFWNFK